MTRHYADLGSASNWSCRVGNLIQPIRSTIKIRVVTRYQYRISVLVSQTSFGRETSGSVAKCRLFSQAIVKLTHNLLSGKQNMRAKKICFTLVLIRPALDRLLQPVLTNSPIIGYDVNCFRSQRRLCYLICEGISQAMPERTRFSQRGRGKRQKLTRKFR